MKTIDITSFYAKVAGITVWGTSAPTATGESDDSIDPFFDFDARSGNTFGNHRLHRRSDVPQRDSGTVDAGIDD